METVENEGRLARAQGCLAGQVAGDSLGSLVEFESAAAIRRRYPDGVRTLSDGGTWNTLAGQPTDDSELALALARSLVRLKRYDQEDAARSYAQWYSSSPFDIGNTIRAALSPAAAAVENGGSAAAAARSAAHRQSQANGALMRVSPLGIFGVRLSPAELAGCSRADAALTHPHPACREANAAFTAAIACAIREAATPERIYETALAAIDAGEAPSVAQCLRDAASRPPADFERNQGWVLIALQNAFFQLLHGRSLKESLIETVGHGGDTDTNAAIAGALLGAAWGIEAVPRQWLECVRNCRPDKGRPGVMRPRPPEYWPVDILTLAEELLAGG